MPNRISQARDQLEAEARHAVNEQVDSGTKPAHIARDAGVDPGNLSAWLNHHQKGRIGPDGLESLISTAPKSEKPRNTRTITHDGDTLDAEKYLDQINQDSY